MYGKSVQKLASSLVFNFLVGSLLVSCGTSDKDLALKANCERIFTNLKEISTHVEVFPDSKYASDDSVALLLGENSRESAEEKILTKYPFLDEIIVGKEKGKQQPDLYYYVGSIFLIAESLKGTDIEFPYSREEMFSIATQENGWRDVVNPLATTIFGDYLDPDNNQGCTLVDETREEENSDDYLKNFNTSVEFDRASDDYLNLADFLQAIRNCEVSGWHVTNKCAMVDYVSEPSAYTTTDELTEEEKAILVQRERDSQGSTGLIENLNVMPFQLCDNLGLIVQAESYGKLICKYVLINRIRTLAWVRL